MTTNKDCQNLREDIAALVMGELDTTKAKQLKQHIKDCPDCLKLYKAMVAEEKMIRSTFDVLAERGRNLEEAVAKKATKKDGGAVILRPAWWKSPVAIRIAAVAAAAVLIITAIVAIQAFTSDEGGIKKLQYNAQEQRERLNQMLAASDVTGITKMLGEGLLETKIYAAKLLGQIGDMQAAEALAKYVELWTGAAARNPFTNAIEQIHTRLAGDPSQIPPDEPNEAVTEQIPEPNKILLTAVPTEAEPNYVLCGHITDTLTGEPVTDAEVEIFVRRIYTTKTDPNGFYHFDKVDKDGNYHVRISSTDYIGFKDSSKSPMVELKAGASTVKNFKLQRACQIEITVVDEQGDPIKDARIRTSSLSDEHGREVGNRDYSRKTDENGVMLLGGFEPSDDTLLFIATHEVEGPLIERNGHRYRATLWDYAANYVTAKLTDADVIETAKLVLHKGVDVKGYCEYADGVPAHGLSISAHPQWWHCTYYPPIVPIDPNGYFTLPQIVPGKYTLHIHIPHGDGSGTSFTIGQMEYPIVDELLYAKVPKKSPGSLASISGRIVYVGEKKPSMIEISAFSPTGGNQFVNIMGEENFKIDSLEPGKYHLRFSGNGIEEKRIANVEAPSNDLVVELECIDQSKAKPVLKGFVVRADNGQPVTQFKARARKMRTLSGANYVQSDRWSEFANPNGSFSVPTVGPGVYQVQIGTDGFAWLWSDQINTDQNNEVTISLTPGGSITGKVIDTQGLPVPGATVTPLSKASGTMPRVKDVFVSTNGSVTTDENGLYVLNNTTSGNESIKVTCDKYCFALRKNIPVSEGKVTENVDVILLKGGSIEGHVLDNTGKPESNVTLMFQDATGYDGCGDEEAGRFATATTDTNGFYHVDNLPEQMCHIRRSSYYASLGVVRRSVLPQNGVTLRVDFGGLPVVDGQLVIDGQPLSDARVQLGDSSSPHFGLFQCYARTDTEGLFRFTGVPTGRYGVYYEVPDKRGEWIKVAVIESTGQDMNIGIVPAKGTTVKIYLESGQGNVQTVLLQDGTGISGGKVGNVEAPTQAGEPYVVKDVTPGIHTVVVYTTSHITMRERIEVHEGQQEVTVKISALAGTGTVAGEFKSDGQQAILLYSADKKIMANVYALEGIKYRIENLPAGEYCIGSFFAYNYNSAPFFTFNLSDGQTKTLDIDTSKLSTVQNGMLIIQVTGSDGIPLSTARLWLEGQGYRIEPMSNTKDGYIFMGPIGSYILHAENAGYQQATATVQLEKVEPSQLKSKQPKSIKLQKL